MYFPKPGPACTEQTIQIALVEAAKRGIRDIVVASTRGGTAMMLREFDGNVVSVTHAYGYAEKGQCELAQEMREKLLAAGIKVLSTTHVLSGVERGISNQFKGSYPAEIISNALRMLGQGTKVCVEIAIMALDAGLIPYGKEVIAIGGTGGGADTALIMTPAHANEVFKVRIHEILCKPYR